MSYIVMTQDRRGVRSAVLIEDISIADAFMTYWNSEPRSPEHSPASITILPAKEDRPVPYLLPSDPEDDVLMHNYVAGGIQHAELSSKMVLQLHVMRTIAAGAGQ